MVSLQRPDHTLLPRTQCSKHQESPVGIATMSLPLFPRTILMELRREKKNCIGLKLERRLINRQPVETMLVISSILNERTEILILISDHFIYFIYS